MLLPGAQERLSSVADTRAYRVTEESMHPARCVETLPNELWMMTMAHLDAAAAAAVRAVSKDFCRLIDTVHPELLLPKASRLFQSRPQKVDVRLVEDIVLRAKTLTFRDTPSNKIITVPKYWDDERCSEPERIWQMIKWAPQLLNLSISHVDALSDEAGGSHIGTFPAGLQHLALEGAHGSLLHPKLFDNLFTDGLAHLQSLHLERLHLINGPYTRQLFAASLFPQLTSLELHHCFMSAQMSKVLSNLNVCTLRNLVLAVNETISQPSVTPSPPAIPAVLDFIGKNRATLKRLVVKHSPPLAKGTVTSWFTLGAWPNLQSLRFSGLHLSAQELRIFDAEIFTSLTRLRLADTPASQESLRALGQMQGREWRSVSLGQDDWTDVTRADQASWLLEPAFAKLQTLRLRLSVMDVQAAKEIILRFGQHIMGLSLTNLDIGAVHITSLASMLDCAHLPHLAELEIKEKFLEVPGVDQIFAHAPFRVWVEQWDEDGIRGFYLQPSMGF